jgi:hypothetical protein
MVISVLSSDYADERRFKPLEFDGFREANYGEYATINLEII